MTSSADRVGRTSGKINKPGPDSPGGPRIEKQCEVCRESFWPRAVDVANGHGRHCSTNCSSKAFRIPKRCACGNVRSDSAKTCAACAPTQQKKKRVCKHCSSVFQGADRMYCNPHCAVAAQSSTIEIAGKALSVDDISDATGKARTTVKSQMQAVRSGVLPLSRLLSEKADDTGGAGNPWGHKGKQITFNAETLSIRQWGIKLGMTGAAISKRLARLPLEEALSKPKKVSNV